MRSLFELRPLLRQDELALAEASLAEASLADDVALPSQLSRLPETNFDIGVECLVPVKRGRQRTMVGVIEERLD